MLFYKALSKIIFGLTFVFSVSSCFPDIESNYGKWEFSQITDIQSNRIINNNEIEFGSSIFINKDKFFLLSIRGIDDVFFLTENSFDGTIFLDRSHSDFQNQVLFGKWNNDDKKKLKFEIQNYQFKKPLVFDIKKIKNKEFDFTVNTVTKHNYIFQYKKTEEDTKRSQYDFVNEEYNKWRIPAKKSETDEQIKARVVQAIDFAVVYMKYHQEQDLLAGIDFLRPLPFYFAANGFKMQQDSAWENLFYNREEARKSYLILSEAFSKNSEKPKREFDGNSVKMITLLFEDLKEALE